MRGTFAPDPYRPWRLWESDNGRWTALAPTDGHPCLLGPRGLRVEFPPTLQARTTVDQAWRRRHYVFGREHQPGGFIHQHYVRIPAYVAQAVQTLIEKGMLHGQRTTQGSAQAEVA